MALLRGEAPWISHHEKETLDPYDETTSLLHAFPRPCQCHTNHILVQAKDNQDLLSRLSEGEKKKYHQLMADLVRA